jgi:hypothetical protein
MRSTCDCKLWRQEENALNLGEIIGKKKWKAMRESKTALLGLL